MPYSQIEWITFDIGGTLLFPNPSVGDIYAEVLSRHGYNKEPQLLEEAFMRIWKKEVMTCMPAITAETEKERWRGVIVRTFTGLAPGIDMDLLFDDLWVAFAGADRWRLPAHTETTLAELQSRGYRLAVLSNWDDRLRTLLAGIGLDRYFEEIFVSCEVGFEKPDGRLFTTVEEQLQASGSQILHIGDSHHHDVLGANARGWRAIQIFGNAAPESESPRVDCLSQLLPLLPGRAR